VILRNVRTPDERQGDLAAQLASHEVGARRAQEIVARYGLDETRRYAAALLEYAERLTRHAIAAIPDGVYEFADHLDADSEIRNRQSEIPIRVKLTIDGDSLTADFTGSAPAVRGNLNAVRAIVESAVFYCVRCVVGAGAASGDIPTNAGTFAPIRVIIPEGSLLDARPPHAVAGGNVETSQRIVDAVFGALAQALPDLVPAASQGTMNNLTFGGVRAGGTPFAYYETMGGGAGAGPSHDGASGIHAHMSNTLNTPIEALERTYPIRVRRYAIRRGSGGVGQHRGGEGLIREIEFLTSAGATLLSERRESTPYGLAGGEPGAPGENTLIRDGLETRLPGKVQLQLDPGDVLSIRTPGGGGWGRQMTNGE